MHAALGGVAISLALAMFSTSSLAAQVFPWVYAPTAQSTPGAPDVITLGTTKYRVNPAYKRQTVRYDSGEPVGTIIVDTRQNFLYLQLGDGLSLRYGIGTARDGFDWRGTNQISAKREWPDWTPPAEMLRRQPGIPHHMEGGIDNPLGARALYIGNTLYRIHGTNEPWTIGHYVSSGCIRLTNEDVIDLYARVKIGAKVIVL
jgi:lipoprotein-anchoring transpeptidase ErfK/SrfK